MSLFIPATNTQTNKPAILFIIHLRGVGGGAGDPVDGVAAAAFVSPRLKWMMMMMVYPLILWIRLPYQISWPRAPAQASFGAAACVCGWMCPRALPFSPLVGLCSP